VSWDPLLDITGDPVPVVVSATDIASGSACGRYLALKTRRQVRAAGWGRTFGNAPFPLGDVQRIVIEAHDVDGVDTYDGLRAWLDARLMQGDVHPLLQEYVKTAVENVLDAHDAIETEVGHLRLVRWWPSVGRRPRELNVWAPLYATEDGTREVRRVRIGSVHDEPDDDDVRWAAAAGFVAARYAAVGDCRRVRVVEIGAGDGSLSVLFDGTPEQAGEQYRLHARDRALALTEQDHVVPCSSCGDCKSAGVCASLLKSDGLLGQPGPGVASRSIAPTALVTYAECPAQWLLHTELHLPRDRADDGTLQVLARGAAVHRWLEAAHGRGVACTASDLPDPGDGRGPGEAALTDVEYALARPYLLSHLTVCPFAVDGAQLVAAELAVHAWDASAQAVAVAKPDLLYRLGDRLIARETKSRSALPAGRTEAYDRHLQVPFLLSLLADGLVTSYGATKGSVELEVLLPGQPGEVWVWNTDDAITVAVARSDVRRAVEEWHVDTEWTARPGRHCGRCPVRRWCPHRDAWQTPLQAPANAGVTQMEIQEYPADDAEPPF
jgi:hypothetical protein